MKDRPLTNFIGFGRNLSSKPQMTLGFDRYLTETNVRMRGSQMRSWNISLRFTLSVLVFVIPLVAMTYYIYVAASNSVEFSRKEIQGAVLLTDLSRLQAEIIEAHFKSIIDEKDINEKAKEDFMQRWNHLIAQSLVDESRQKKVNKSFSDYLNSDIEERKLGGRFLMFYQDLGSVRESIANHYNVVLDPDLDSFYTMDLLVNLMPEMLESYLQLAQIVGGADDILYDFQKRRFLNSQAHFEEIVKTILQNLERIKVSDTDFYGVSDSFQTKYPVIQTNVREQLREYYSLVMHVDRSLVERKKTYEVLLSLNRQSAELFLDVGDAFNRFLEIRVHSLVSDRDRMLYMSTAAMLFALLLSVFLGFSIRDTIGTFHAAVKRLRSGSGLALEVGQNLITASSKVANSSSVQAAAIEQTSASLEELSSIVSVNAQSSVKARELASEAKGHATEGSREMQMLMGSMNEISQSSKKIEEIMKIIDDIAFQTNLLALNASVEAARAGEHGKGFAVVADAVRALAQKSADSAKEIGSLITDSLVKIENGKNTADRSGASMNAILTSIENVSILNGEIANASQEQTVGIQQISKAVHELERGTIENSGVAQQSMEYSNMSLAQAEEIMTVVDMLERELLGAGKKSQQVEKADLNFQEAIQAHLKWKGRLKNYIEGIGGEKLDSRVVCQDNQCPLGKWIHGSGQKYAHFPMYSVLKKEHALFHKAAGDIVVAVQKQDKNVSIMIADGSEFDKRTKSTVSALQELDAHLKVGG